MDSSLRPQGAVTLYQIFWNPARGATRRTDRFCQCSRQTHGHHQRQWQGTMLAIGAQSGRPRPEGPEHNCSRIRPRIILGRKSPRRSRHYRESWSPWLMRTSAGSSTSCNRTPRRRSTRPRSSLKPGERDGQARKEASAACRGSEFSTALIGYASIATSHQCILETEAAFRHI